MSDEEIDLNALSDEDLVTQMHDDLYDGPATIDGRVARVRLAGHLDPIDGQYHWRGTVFDTLPDDARNPMTVTIERRSASARFTERSQQGGYSITGVGVPPFAR